MIVPEKLPQVEPVLAVFPQGKPGHHEQVHPSPRNIQSLQHHSLVH